MPIQIPKTYVIRKRGDEWCVMDEAETKTLGCHNTEEEAQQQLRAIEASKHASEQTIPELLTITDREIFAAGSHNGDKYSVEDLDAIIEAFHSSGYVPPLKQGHTTEPGAPALGAIANLRRIGNKLIADFVDLTKDVYEMIRSRKFRAVSPEIYWNLKRDGKLYRRFMSAVALLGSEMPAVPGLKPVYAELQALAFESIRQYEYKPEGPMEILVSIDQMAKICPPCAEKMKAKNFTAIKLQSKDGGKTYAFPGGMPEEAFNALCERFAPDEGFRTRCMDSGAAGEVSDPGAFCNALKSACQDQGKLAEKSIPKTATEEMTKMKKDLQDEPAARKVVERDGKWCIVVGDETEACYDSEAEAQSKLSEGQKPKVTIDQGLDALMDDLGLKTDRETLKKQLVGAEFVHKSELEKVQKELSEREQRDLKQSETRRQERIAAKVASVLPPALRPHLASLYEIATKETRMVAFAASPDKVEERSLESVVDDLRVYLERWTRRMFGETAFTEVKRMETPGVDPRAELDKRVREYCVEQKLNPDNPDDYLKARDEIFKADPDLKRAYALS